MKINSILNLNNICNYRQNSKKALYPNLAPLQRDIVCFGSKAEFKPKGLMAFMPSEYMCERVEIAASGAQEYLDRVVGDSLYKISSVQTLSSKEKVPTFTYSSNIKSAQSIREKVVSKYAKISKNEDEEFSNQLTDLLIENIPFKNKYNDRKRLYTEVVFYSVEKAQIPSKKPPYKHINDYFDAVVNRINSLDIIDYTKISPDNLEEVYKHIKEELENTNRPDKEENYVGSFYINPQTIKGIKHYANDIVRGRIVMNVPEKSSAEQVLDCLEQDALKGRIKIKSVENYLPAANMLPKGKRISDYEYTKEQKVINFAENVGAKYIKADSVSGYMGIHINLDMTNSCFGKKNDITNGYQAEIQLIGRDVMQLKDVEDLCYKIKDSKTSYDEMYKPFKAHFDRYYNDSNKAAFDEYTYSLYLYQRTLPANANQKKFPSIKELGFSKRVPEQLDFNILSELKDLCERNKEIKDRIRKSI